MNSLLKQSSTARALYFLMVDSTDHVTGKTGLSPTVTICKEGGSFAAPAGAVSEVSSGWYKVAGNATDTGTLGSLLLHATGTAADPVDLRFDVVAFDPADAVRLGLTALPNAAADAAGGLPISDAGGLDMDAQVVTKINALPASITAAERNVRQTIESQRGHHTGCGSVFYVQKGGSDANPGTYLLPFLTIQAALNACTANAHDTVVVLGVAGQAPSVFDEALTMSKAYVFLRGMGRDTKIIRTGAASKNITISANGCEVSGFWINNTGSGATEGISLASGSDFAWLHHLFIDGTSAAMTGIEVVAGANTTIENCRINDVLGSGIDVAQGAAVGLHTRILSNHIDGCGTGINFAGGDSSESVARYNNISGCTTGVVVASGALKVQVTDNRFSGNTTDWTDAGTNTNLSWNALSTSISGAVSRVTLADTITTYTGNTPQTGDTFSLANGAAGFVAIDAVVDAIKAKTDNLPASPAAVGSAMTLANDSVTAAALAADAVAEIQSGLSTLNAAGVRSAIGLASANLDTQLDALPTAAENRAEMDANSTKLANLDATVGSRLATASYTAPLSAVQTENAVWDATMADHLDVGTTGKELSDAGGAGTPLTSQEVRDAMKLSPTAGAPAAGSVDEHLDLTALDATVAKDSTVSKPGTAQTISSNADITAIKAKTDNLPTSPAAVGSAMTLSSGERSTLVDLVWDELLAGHVTVNSAGKVLADAGTITPTQVADAVWGALRATYEGAAGTYGQYANANLTRIAGSATVDGLPLTAWYENILAHAAGDIVRSVNTYDYKKQDGVTTAFTFTSSAGGRS